MSATVRDLDGVQNEHGKENNSYKNKDGEKGEPSTKPGSGASERVNLDTVLAGLGQLGSFQWKLFALCAVVAIFSAWSASEYLFTTTRIETRCLIPECESVGDEWSPAWLEAAIPDAGTDNCQRFAPAALANTSLAGTCSAALFDQATLQACEQYVYENTNTVVYDFDMACDEWRRTLIGSMRVVGTLLSMPLTGFISDRWGRRVVLAFHAVNSAWLGLVRYWAATYVGFMISEIVESTIGSGLYTSAYILLLEVLTPKYRTAGSAAMMSCWALGQMTLGLIAWGVPHWQNLTLTLYIPQFVSVFYFWIATESARWYLSKGRYAEAEAILEKMAQTNGKTLDPKSLEAVKQTAEDDRRQQELELEQNKKQPWLIVIVFRHKRVLLRCIVAPVWWVTNTFIYYGLSINAVNMVGNRFLNYVFVSAVEIPGFWTAHFLLDRIGRKPVLTGAFWICTCCQIAYIFISSDMYGLSLTFYLLGKFAIATVAQSIYVYTLELYPTKHRHTLFAFTSMVGRIGSIIAPLTPAFGASTFEEFPFVLFGSFALLSGFLMFLAPETRGTKLPDTMEEAENL